MGIFLGFFLILCLITFLLGGSIILYPIYFITLLIIFWYGGKFLQKNMEVTTQKEDGLHTESFKNGLLLFEQNYKDGQLDGLYKRWFESSQLRYEGNFKNGKKDGLIQEWYESGHLQYKMNYKNGEYDGKVEKWYENGQLLYEQTYKNGKLTGFTSYKENGAIKK